MLNSTDRTSGQPPTWGLHAFGGFTRDGTRHLPAPVCPSTGSLERHSVSSGTMSTCAKKLKFGLSHTKLSTSEFLIDNFRGFSCSQAFPAFSVCHPAASNTRLSAVDSRLLCLIDNDMHSRKESSCCKHSTYEMLIDNEFHCHERRSPLSSHASSASLPPSFHSRLPTLDCRSPFLIANDMHSREESSSSKQSTYEILIANELHCSANLQIASSIAFSASQSPLVSPSQVHP